ncbi:MAG: hypothetical protein ACFCGT_10675 [Sandaracinaceae bacterium]
MIAYCQRVWRALCQALSLVFHAIFHMRGSHVTALEIPPIQFSAPPPNCPSWIFVGIPPSSDPNTRKVPKLADYFALFSGERFFGPHDTPQKAWFFCYSATGQQVGNQVDITHANGLAIQNWPTNPDEVTITWDGSELPAGDPSFVSLVDHLVLTVEVTTKSGNIRYRNWTLGKILGP